MLKGVLAIILGTALTLLIVLVSALHFTFVAVWNVDYSLEEAKQAELVSRGGQDFIGIRRNRYLYTEAFFRELSAYVVTRYEWERLAINAAKEHSNSSSARNVPSWMIPSSNSRLGAYIAANPCLNLAPICQVVAYGFPFRCCWGAQVNWDPGSSNRVCQELHFGMWRIERRSVGQPIEWVLQRISANRDNMVVPYNVLWRGLLLDCIAWSGVMYGLLVAAECFAIAVRSRFRRKRGVCVGCAYPWPVGVPDARCPECGTVKAPT